MIPGLSVRMGDQAEVIVEPTTNGLWLADETVGGVANAPKYAILLAVAFYAIDGETPHPVSMGHVREWARYGQVRVEEVEE